MPPPSVRDRAADLLAQLVGPASARSVAAVMAEQGLLREEATTMVGVEGRTAREDDAELLTASLRRTLVGSLVDQGLVPVGPVVVARLGEPCIGAERRPLADGEGVRPDEWLLIRASCGARPADATK